MSRVLVVTPYPPSRDGIAAYAIQQVAALRADGDDVTVLSPGPSAAHHHLALAGMRGAASLAKHIRGGGYDRVIVQFHPDFFYPIGCSTAERARISAALTGAFALARRVEVYVHEIDYRHGHGLRGLPMRLMWRQVDIVHVHTQTERHAFIDAFGAVPSRVVVTEHGRDFARRTSVDRDSARASLGIAADEFLFLSIGFIQEHKGFDRAVRAFDGLAARGASRYAIVGSLRIDEPDVVAYRDRLRRLVDATDGAELHEQYVTDELFDKWIVACDVVVLPYRAIWSSGVLERARLYDRPVIATAVGGLAEQVGDAAHMTFVADDEQLATAMWTAAGAMGAVPPAGDWVSRWAQQSEGVDAAAVQRDVESRADVLRAHGVRHVNDRPGTITVRRSAPAGGREPQDGPSAGTAAGTASARLRRLPMATVPEGDSRLPGGRMVKRAISRLTRWQVQPLADTINAVRAATADAVEELERRR